MTLECPSFLLFKPQHWIYIVRLMMTVTSLTGFEADG